MRDLQHQLRDYWVKLAAGLPAPTAEQALIARVGEGAVRPLVDRPGPRPRPALAAAGRALLDRRRGEMAVSQTAQLHRWRRPAVVALGAAALTLVVGGLTLYFVGQSREAPPVTTVTSAVPTTTLPPTTTVAPSTTAGTTTTLPPATTTTLATTTTVPAFPDALDMTWARVPDQEALHSGYVAAATLGGPGLVAVGASTGSGVGAVDAAVWVSADGATWERIASDTFRGEPNQFGTEGEQYMNDVLSWSGGLVAVGTDGQLGGAHRAVVWLSTDGRTWSRATDGEVFAGASMQAVTVGGPGLIAGGSADRRAAIWASSDGLEWQRVLEGDRYEEIEDVVAWGGRYFAVGTQGHYDFYSNLTDPPFRALVWVSEDGRTWERLPDGTREGQPGIDLGTRWPDVMSRLRMLLADESGLMALGSTFTVFGPGGESPRTWHSTDGQSWQMGTGQFLGYSPWANLFTDLIAANGRLLASHGAGEIWGSADGGAYWHRVTAFEFGSGAGAGGELIPTGAASSIESVNALLFLEGSVFAFGKDGVWSRSEDIGGGTCNADPGDGSLGQCRSDAVVWIGTFDG